MMVDALQVKRLGGWARLWVVASVIWVAGCGLMLVGNWPDREDYQLVSSVTVEADALAPAQDAPDQASSSGAAPPQNSSVSSDELDVVSSTQYDDEAYENAKLGALVGFGMWSVVVPALLAAAMFAIGWIWRGFIQPKSD